MVDDFLCRVSSFCKMCIEQHCSIRFQRSHRRDSQKHHKIGFVSDVVLTISSEEIPALNAQLLDMSQKLEKRAVMKYAPTQPTHYYSVDWMC